MTGVRVGRLVVLEYAHTDKEGNAHWHCRCDCGNPTTVSRKYLRLGQANSYHGTQSCGCLRREAALANITAWHASAARKFLMQVYREAKAKRKGANL
jgi:hypothetical protein